MFNITNYLKKFANIESNLTFQKEIITKTLKELCDLDVIDFEIRNGTLYLKASPTVKSIVFMKKDQIVAYLKKNFPQGRIGDIR
ncbi:MAG: hypothetical protein AAB484_02135 [Patescibacteria group bacterium]